MNKKTYIALIFILAGIAFFGLGLFFSHGNIKSVSSNMNSADERKTYECSSKIDTILLSECSNGVRIETGNVSAPTLSYMEGKTSGELEIKENGSTVSFNRKSPKTSFSFTIMDITDYTTVLTLPADYSGSLDIASTSGSIKLSAELNVKDFEATATSGSVIIDKLTSQNGIILKTTSGAIKLVDSSADGNVSAGSTSGSVLLENVAGNGNIEITSTSGSLKLVNVSGNKDVSANSTSGSVTIENVYAGSDVKFRSTSGSIRFNDLKAAGDIALHSNSGSINGSIEGKESDYSIISSTTSGSCNLTNSRSGDKKLDVTTTSGSIRIEFTK